MNKILLSNKITIFLNNNYSNILYCNTIIKLHTNIANKVYFKDMLNYIYLTIIII